MNLPDTVPAANADGAGRPAPSVGFGRYEPADPPSEPMLVVA